MVKIVTSRENTGVPVSSTSRAASISRSGYSRSYASSTRLPRSPSGERPSIAVAAALTRTSRRSWSTTTRPMRDSTNRASTSAPSSPKSAPSAGALAGWMSQPPASARGTARSGTGDPATASTAARFSTRSAGWPNRRTAASLHQVTRPATSTVNSGSRFNSIDACRSHVRRRCRGIYRALPSSPRTGRPSCSASGRRRFHRVGSGCSRSVVSAATGKGVKRMASYGVVVPVSYRIPMCSASIRTRSQ